MSEGRKQLLLCEIRYFLYPYHIITNSSISVLSIFIHNIHYTAFMAQCQEICLYISAQALKITCFLFFKTKNFRTEFLHLYSIANNTIFKDRITIAQILFAIFI